MGETNWTGYGTETNALTTGLNSLADGGESAPGTEIDNATNLDMFMDLNIALASLTPTGASHVVVKIVSTVDGTTYEDGDASPRYFAAISTGVGAKRASLRGIPIGPGKYKLTLTNECGVALASSGNTVKYRTYSPTTA